MWTWPWSTRTLCWDETQNSWEPASSVFRTASGPWRRWTSGGCPTETDAVIEELTSAIAGHGLHAIKFNTLTYMVSDEPWDGGAYRPFWDAATGLGVPVFFTLGTGPDSRSGGQSMAEQREGYVNELRILMRWMERYPDTVCSLTHGFPWRVFLEGDRIVLPEEVWAPFENPNCNLEVCFPVRLGDLFEFPYRELWPTLEQMVDRVGVEHLLWGTDMPFQEPVLHLPPVADLDREVLRVPDRGRPPDDHGWRRGSHSRAGGP